MPDVLPFGVGSVPGISTLLGTTHDDNLNGSGVFTQVLGGEGNDMLNGAINLIWVEKLYGGTGDDWIKWSKGENIVHGGQTGTLYADDGLDTIDYSGVGEVHIIATKHAVEHKTPTYISDFNGGSDQMFSIEQVAWDKSSDVVTTGEGVDLLEKPLLLDLKTNGAGRGDSFGMINGDTPLIINAVDNELTSVQTAANAGLDAGYWVRSAEWLQGSQAGDQIYSGSATLGVEGEGGDDLLDGRLAIPFSGQSPLGYDVELYGGDGNDTIVAGAGYTYANGGAGSDKFVISAMSGPATAPIELDIDAADGGDYDGSTLFQLSGAPFQIAINNPVSLFSWGPTGDDQIHGNIEFVGEIAYQMDGSDLLITIQQDTRKRSSSTTDRESRLARPSSSPFPNPIPKPSFGYIIGPTACSESRFLSLGASAISPTPGR